MPDEFRSNAAVGGGLFVEFTSEPLREGEPLQIRERWVPYKPAMLTARQGLAWT